MAAALLLMIACWALPTTADAACGDWLAGGHATDGGRHQQDGSRQALRHDFQSRVAFADGYDPGAELPASPCRGLRCSPPAPGPAPPVSLPTTLLDQWALRGTAPEDPARNAVGRDEPALLFRREHHGADIFRPPR